MLQICSSSHNAVYYNKHEALIVSTALCFMKTSPVHEKVLLSFDVIRSINLGLMCKTTTFIELS